MKGTPLFSRCLSGVLLCFVLGLSASVTLADSVNRAEREISKSDQIKAGLLLQFASYIKWPSRREDSVDLCLVGEDAFGSFIDEMVRYRGTNRQGQKITIRRMGTEEDSALCHIGFFSNVDEFEHWVAQNEVVDTMLLVGDDPAFLELGGMIRMYSEEQRIRLMVHLDNAKRSNIVISSELLRVSKVVYSQGASQ